MNHLPGKFVWFEHISSEPAKARKFYEPLFGWHVESMPTDGERYLMILNRNEGIGGFRGVRDGSRAHWLGYLSVDDVDDAWTSALAAGARTVAPPAEFPPYGRGATIADRWGAVFALWKSRGGDRPDAPETAAGGWCWNELWTRDEIGALAFYQRVFGYSHESMDLGDAGTYYVLKKDGVGRAGMMRSTQPKAPSMWLPYVAVAHCDTIASRAPHLGGQLLAPPTDIPDVGRFAVLADPTGAAIAVLEALPAVAVAPDPPVA